jgi:hypothetical protein
MEILPRIKFKNNARENAKIGAGIASETTRGCIPAALDSSQLQHVPASRDG